MCKTQDEYLAMVRDPKQAWRVAHMLENEESYLPEDFLRLRLALAQWLREDIGKDERLGRVLATADDDGEFMTCS